MFRRSSAVLVAVVLAVGITAAGCSTYRVASGRRATTPSTPTRVGAVGSGGMAGMMGMMSGAGSTVTPAEARSLTRHSESYAVIDGATKTITFCSQQVEIIALATPDMTWYIDGMVNPTLNVPRNATVTLHLINTDQNRTHGWELTTAMPPYSTMPMMHGSLDFAGAFAVPLSEATAQRWPERSVSFNVTTAGTYYYVCPVPGHAQRGMFGKLIVR